MRETRQRACPAIVVLALAAISAAGMSVVVKTPAARGATSAVALPSGFQLRDVVTGLTAPTAVEFARDGRIFVAEKGGLIKVLDGAGDTTPVTFADLRSKVPDYWDRGVLGLALHPDFPATPLVYVLYAYDAVLGGTAPRWGDACPTPPGGTSDGCVVSGRLSRLTASGNVSTGDEQVLIEDWCQHYPSHTIGTLVFGTDGALYAGAGDAASFTRVDYGQDGFPQSDATPDNPCGDPPSPVGVSLTPPSAEGGALRSQDLRTPADRTTLDGSIIRVDPDTGQPLDDNPLFGREDINAARIVATGLRNPFRFTVRPGTDELWVGDVGWNAWEEINRVPAPNDGTVDNFGWPCYEGGARQPAYDAANLRLCEDLYAAGPNAVAAPYYAYHHDAAVASGDVCPTGTSSISGISFAGDSNYPPAYDGALFFGDYSRGCIWTMRADAAGLPDPTTASTFATGVSVVQLKTGPAGDIYLVDLMGGRIQRIVYTGTNPPEATATATPSYGAVPLTVKFDASQSSDRDPGETLSYAWDLDGDGSFDDSTAMAPTRTYTAEGKVAATLRVTDSRGLVDEATVSVVAGDSPPTTTITKPTADSVSWRVGDTLTFSGTATDAKDGALPASALQWRVLVRHCPGDCHTHVMKSFEGVSGDSFGAPDHDYPSHLELELTARDSAGLAGTSRVRLDPKTVVLGFETNPPGLRLASFSGEDTTPFSRTVIAGSSNSISAPSPQLAQGHNYAFRSWSDEGLAAQDVNASRDVTADASTTYTATFDVVPIGMVAEYSLDEPGGTAVIDTSGFGNDGVLAREQRTSGRYGRGILLSRAGDGAIVPDSTPLRLGTGLTLEEWVRPSRMTYAWHPLLSKVKGDGTRAYALEVGAGGRQLRLSVAVGGTNQSLVTGFVLNPYNWSHVAGTYDGKALRLYVNGNLVASRPLTGAIASSTGRFRIGGGPGGRQYLELVDEARVYDRALSPTEINADLNRPITPR